MAPVSSKKIRGIAEHSPAVRDYRQSLRKAAAITLNIRISKAQRLSNWEAQQLTPAQQLYAATDAWVGREIFKKLSQSEPEKPEEPVSEKADRPTRFDGAAGALRISIVQIDQSFGQLHPDFPPGNVDLGNKLVGDGT